MKAKFSLPGFYSLRPVYEVFLNLINDYPEILLPNTEIDAIFGIFPNTLWNGGGSYFGHLVEKDEIQETINYYNQEWNIPLRFTFTNVFAGEDLISDRYSNLIAECGHNGKNEILTSNNQLEAYLRKTYPNYRYCRSIIAAHSQPYDLANGRYYISVMQRAKNNDWDYLNTIPQLDRSSIEFLCTDLCPDNCPRIYTHYRDLARAQLSFLYNDPRTECTMKEVKGTFPLHYWKTNCKTRIDRQMIDVDYLPKDFCRFKISGRGSPVKVVLLLAEYMIQPEYQQDVINLCLQDYCN